MGRLISILFALLAAATPLSNWAAAVTEKGAYQAAAQAFQDRNYARAEAEFAAFVNQFTNSAQVPEAVLFQAEARLEQKNYDGAIELLKARLPLAGSWTDHYLFWLGESCLRKGDYQQAGEHFARLIKEHPASSRRLEAALSETMARAKLNQWPRVIELLQDPNGVFQVAARANATNELALRGYLMLSEAQLAQKDYAAAQAALQPISALPLQPRLAWQRQYLTTRVHLDQGQMEPARVAATNLLDLAAKANEKPLLAESYALYAGLLERLDRTEEAIDNYEKNLADGVPAERQRHALFKIAELSLAKQNLARATLVLDRFTAQHKGAPFRDLGLLTLGELRLRQHISSGVTNLPPAQAPTGTNAPPSTNHIDQAVAALSTLISDFPQSEFLGKAHLDLGWCHWVRNDLPQAAQSFQAAAERLPQGHDKAVALFKLADTRFRLNDLPGAITNYTAVVSDFTNSPDTKAALIEPALYQLARAGLAAGNLAATTNALLRIVTEYPTNYYTERAVLVAGQALNRTGNPEAARRIFSDFTRLAPDAPLAEEVRLGIARTLESQGQWTNAVGEYESWLARYTNSPALARATYSLAWANLRAGRETNAFQLFTNFTARFPNDDLAPIAQWWTGDFYYRNGSWSKAEEIYQLLYNNPKVATNEIAYQARLMAGRTAFQRRGWVDATRYFTNLSSDLKCPQDIWVQAGFAYGNVLMTQPSTNKLDDYREAVNAFNKIYVTFPTNPIAVLALGEKASCLLQWAQTLPQYEAAAQEFQKVLTNQLASPTARAISRVGLAVVQEKQAQQKTGDERTNLLKAAQTNYLDVFYFSKDLKPEEKPDLFWVKKAGLEAARLMESLGDWSQALGIYERLGSLVPALRPTLEKKAGRAKENLAKNLL